MNDCIKDYLTEIIVTSAAFGASFILNCVLAFKLYTKPKMEIYTPPEIELVTLNKNTTEEESLEEYVMTIGKKTEVVKCNVPDWVVEDYKNKKILTNK